MLAEKSSVILQTLPDACVWAVHVAVWVNGGVSSSGVSVVFICSLFRVLMIMFTVPWLDAAIYTLTYKISFTNWDLGWVRKQYFYGTAVFFQHSHLCFLQQWVVATLIYNIQYMGEMNNYNCNYNCKLLDINVECCSFSLHRIFILYLDIFSKDCNESIMLRLGNEHFWTC